MINELDFFRESTRRICSSLEIEKSLASFFVFIREHIPADFVSLAIMNEDIGIMELIAHVNEEGGLLSPFTIPVTPEVAQIHREFMRDADQLHQVYIVNNPRHDLVIGPTLLKMDMADAVVLLMRLKIENEVLGYVVIGNINKISYSQVHADFLSQLNDPFAIALSNHLRYRELSRLKDLLVDDNRFFQDQLRLYAGEEIIGANFGLKRVMDLVNHVAPLSSPVMLLGETGTGKELIANAIHNLSPRKEGPLIKVNCGAIPDSLMDSELFGHEKGAFTGAVAQKRGRFERAHGGTIFLDEVGELPLNAQVRLLRVLQEREIERVGGSNPIKIDIRIITATHRNLEDMLKDKTFREDLYFRLCVFPIMIPPLRERREDIPSLIHHFMQQKAREIGMARMPSIASRTIENLMAYPWPGNIRELQNVVERELILSDGSPLMFKDFYGLSKCGEREAPAPKIEGFPGFDEAISGYILQTLEITNGKIIGDKGTAKLLKINPSTLRKKMNKLGISSGRVKSRGKGDAAETLPAAAKASVSYLTLYGEGLTLAQFASQHILHALEKTNGKIAGGQGAAELLQLNPSTLRKKMLKFGIYGNRSALR